MEHVDGHRGTIVTTKAPSAPSSLRAGDLVEVRSVEEILATLDDDGCLDGLLFMPEMLRFCGERYRVQSRAHKTCDTVLSSGFRRMHAVVHLDELRCDGAGHGGCQAACLLFWKEAWLKPVGPGTTEAGVREQTVPAILERATQRVSADGAEPTYACQATELRQATSDLRWFDPRQYVEDITSRNVTLPRLLRGLIIVFFNKFQAANRQFLSQHLLIKGGRKYPFVSGRVEGRTPLEELNLQPGELVRVKSREEIERTLDGNNRNRGLLFDGVMTIYCGQTVRVRARVEQIIDERTGAMMHMPNPCIMLDGVVCTGDDMQLCPRRIYSYWREIWLERV